jgi:hypothetical protein
MCAVPYILNIKQRISAQRCPQPLWVLQETIRNYVEAEMMNIFDDGCWSSTVEATSP